jgi:hypothetical protein
MPKRSSHFGEANHDGWQSHAEIDETHQESPAEELCQCKHSPDRNSNQNAYKCCGAGNLERAQRDADHFTVQSEKQPQSLKEAVDHNIQTNLPLSMFQRAQCLIQFVRPRPVGRGRLCRAIHNGKALFVSNSKLYPFDTTI